MESKDASCSIDFLNSYDKDIFFYVNDQPHRINNPSPKITVLEYLREIGLTGTKLGCGEGGCGACTVVVANIDTKKNVQHLTANACLLPLCTVHGKQLITVEGIGCPSNPHPVQERLALGHGSQCGFCTPGIVMSMYGLLQSNKEPTIHDIEDSFEGNLCRCTGYRPILDAFKTFSDASTSNEPLEKVDDKHCNIVYSHHSNKTPGATNQAKIMAPCSLSELSRRAPYCPDNDLKFPEDLTTFVKANVQQSLFFEKDQCRWFRPTRLEDLLELKRAHPEAKLVGGNSEIGVEMRLKSMDYRYFIDTSNIKELQSIVWEEKSMEIGVNITLTDFTESLKNQLSKAEEFQKPTLEAFLANLRWFAGRQIRNFATIGGNIATGSPISDLNPIFIATGSILTITSSQLGTRQVPMNEFFKGYRKMDLEKEEVVLRVKVPLANPGQFVRAYKQARRKDDDIAIVNAAFNVQLDTSITPPKIKELVLVYGGMGPTTIHLKETPKLAKGLAWGPRDNLDIILKSILSETEFPYSVVGGMPTYRRTLAASFFKRFWYQTCRDAGLASSEIEVNAHYNIDEIEREETSGKQNFGPAATHDEEKDPLIARTYPHVSSLAQTTGAATYVDDLPKFSGELYAASVLSSQPHAEIISVNVEAALKTPGVHHYISHLDVPGHNEWGILIHDEEFFATKEVHAVGQLIGLIVADSKEIAKKATLLVKVEYKPLDFILTIDEAIAKNSFYEFERRLNKGEFQESIFSDKSLVFIEGECRVGGQEHFYLETQGCIAIPKGENGEMEIIASTQNLAEAQAEVARALNIPANRITCKAKRLGGGFGGKETRATVIAVAVGVAAHVSGRPVRMMLDRDEDMLTSGNRHPFYGKYRLALTTDGFFKALDLEMIANAGCTYDLSRAVLERALTHCDNVYHFPVMRVHGRLAKTNIASNTAFRGFGGPQGMMLTEMMISEAAMKLNMDPTILRKKNLYKEGQLTQFNMKVQDWYVPEMWDTVIGSSNYDQRLELVNTFNSENQWRKRGLALIPTKFAISFGQRFLNQAGALVLIYTDGSVLLNHGGVEMGQGLHTKMIQLCANELQVPLHRVHITESATDKIPNASATAASVSSDINGMAILDACRQLNERLAPYRAKAPPGADLGQIARMAYMDQVSLAANGFYKAPNTFFDWEKGEGGLFLYFTTGVAVAEVEIDVLTGDHVVLSTDLIMDIGNSINFAVDLGQIEGAFIQGMGWCTMEEMLIAKANGRRITVGPGNYKLPGFKDVPKNFNVSILSGKTYHHLPTVKSSKGIGEPPLFLGAVVFFALKAAVQAARNNNDPFDFPSPATAEIIRLACGDDLVACAKVEPTEASPDPWAVRP